MSKKKILTIALCVALVAALVVGASIAYFTDTKEATNVFTIGNVKIELLESKLHRVNAGVTTAGRLSIADPDFKGNEDNTPDAKNSDWEGGYFSDAQIEADAAGYQAWLAEQVLMPGSNTMKCPYVKNTGASDAYVRVRVLIPAVLDNGILATSMYTSSAINNDPGHATLTVTENKTVDGIVYNEYAFTYGDVLEPGAITFWNCWGDIKLGDNTTTEQLEALIASGDITQDSQTGALNFNVLVQADAIQAAGFDTAAAAFVAFDAQMASSATTSPNP